MLKNTQTNNIQKGEVREGIKEYFSPVEVGLVFILKLG